MDDLTFKATEYIVGSSHPTLEDTINRLSLVEHNTDGTHKMSSGVAGDIFYHDGTRLVRLAKDPGKYLLSGASAVSWTTPPFLGNVVEDTTPQLGGNLDSNKKSILLSASLDDHEYEGTLIPVVAGENLSRGQVIYCKLNGGAWKWYKYDANGTDKLILPRAVAVADINTGESGYGLVYGKMRDDTWSLSPSADSAVTVYASGSAGGVTLTTLSTSGDESVVVGSLVGANTILLGFGFGWSEV